MKFPYNRDYSPIVPSLQVTFVSAEKQFSVGPFIALVDTGTDATAVPIAPLEKIMASKSSAIPEGLK